MKPALTLIAICLCFPAAAQTADAGAPDMPTSTVLSDLAARRQLRTTALNDQQRMPLGLPLVVATPEAIFITSDHHGRDHVLLRLEDGEKPSPAGVHAALTQALRDAGVIVRGHERPPVFVALGHRALTRHRPIELAIEAVGGRMWTVYRLGSGELVALRPPARVASTEDRKTALEALEKLGLGGPSSAAPYRNLETPRPPTAQERQAERRRKAERVSALMQLRRSADRCYQTRHAEGLERVGSVTLRFRVSLKGEPGPATVVEDELQDDALMRCLQAAVAEMKLPEDRRTYSLNRTFHFAP